MRGSPRDEDVIEAEDISNTAQRAGVVADAEREMMSGTGCDPALQEGADIGQKEPARVGVAGRRNGAVHALTLGEDEWMLPAAFSPMLSIVMGPSLMRNSTLAPLPGLP